MKFLLIIIFSFFAFLFSCDSFTSKTQDTKNATITDISHQEFAKQKNPFEEILKAIPKIRKPVFGYRFNISGDFDGDGTNEKLTEHFFSGLDNSETNKFYDNLSDYSLLVSLTVKKEPISFVCSDKNIIDTLHISSGGQLLGLLYLKNEGDLNGDGNDEVSYVVNWADWSNTNTCQIVTYKNKKWTELYSFPIWETQLPDLPQTINQHGFFGRNNKIINITNDTINNQLEKELINFKGLVKKVKTNKIQVTYSNYESGEDTKMVDLKSLK